MNAALIKQGRATPAPLRPPELQGDPCYEALFQTGEHSVLGRRIAYSVIMIREKVCLDLG